MGSVPLCDFCYCREQSRQNNNNIHICIAPYGRNFRGAKTIENRVLPAVARFPYVNRFGVGVFNLEEVA